jgi:transglutaminase-like putative cysteine protease
MSDHARLEAIQRWVQDNVGFIFEGQETFPSSLQTVLDGVGDCDDHTLLVIALCSALDYEVTAEAFPAADPAHVAARVLTHGDWLWMETTIPARLGEHPIDAARRLGIEIREDITG